MTAIAFLLTYCLLAIQALFRDPIYGLYLYLGTFFLHPPSRWWGQSLPDVRWAFLSAAIVIIAMFVHSKSKSAVPWYRTTPGMLLIGLVIYMFVQSLWAVEPSNHKVGMTLYAKYLLVFVFVYQIANTPERMAKVLTVIILGCMYLGWLASQAPPSNFFEGRVNGVGGPGISDANSLGMMFAVGIMCASVFVLAAKGWYRIIAFLSLPFMLNGIILAASRGAFLSLAVAGVLLVLLKPPKYRLKFWVLAIGAIFAMASLSDSRFIERMLTLKTVTAEDVSQREASAQSRIVIYEAQLKMAARYPHGAGHKGTAALSPIYLDEKYRTGGNAETGAVSQRSSHNTFLTLLVEQGVFGAMIFFFALAWGVKVSLKYIGFQRRGDLDPPDAFPPIAAICGLVVILFAGIFTDYFLAEVQIWLFAILAASFYQSRLKTKAESTA